jgi:hypothetical protein
MVAGVEIPGLGPVTYDDELGWHRSEALPVPALGGAVCHVLVNGYDDDPAKDEIHEVISAFLTADETAWRAAAPSIFEYYEDVTAGLDADDDWYVEISGPDQVWEHVEVGIEVMVERDPYGDHKVYVSVECECGWEPEHGLQVVFREGRKVTKVGPFNGHLTNANAYDRDDLGDVIYVR